MFLKTAEFRWFWMTEAERSAWEWFAALEALPPTEEPFRQDCYLLLPGCRTAGVKLREERLEVKALVHEAGNCAVPDWPAGPLQIWVKWSLDTAALTQHDSDLQAAGRWQEVGKLRCLRRYLQHADGNVEPIAGSDGEVSETCQVELTRVSLPQSSSTWLTLGFETSCGEDPDDALSRLEATVTHVCGKRRTGIGQRIDAAAASYPGWLVNRKL